MSNYVGVFCFSMGATIPEVEVKPEVNPEVKLEPEVEKEEEEEEPEISPSEPEISPSEPETDPGDETVGPSPPPPQDKEVGVVIVQMSCIGRMCNYVSPPVEKKKGSGIDNLPFWVCYWFSLINYTTPFP